jgi:hypothetical protein
MKKHFSTLLTLLFVGIFTNIKADPYILPSEGLGQYGYLEVDATTYVRLNHGGFNVHELAARWWTGAEYLYYGGLQGTCAQHELSTSNYSSGNHANWAAGTIAYVSVRFRDCSSNWNGTNYNERDFRLINLDNTYSGALDNDLTDNPTGTSNLIGSFTLSSGGNALTLDRLWLRNTGTAQEGSDLPNGSIRIYYEAITGSETFNGNESFVTIYGDYGGNSTSNEEWGSDDLNLPIGTAGVRCYAVVADLSAGFTLGNTVQFEIISDGISFQEARNGSYRLMRMDATSITAAAAPLPVTLTAFDAEKANSGILLRWETASERNNERFDIQRSPNGTAWNLLASVPSKSSDFNRPLRYDFLDENPFEGTNYYRLQQVDLDGKTALSKVVKIETSGKAQVSVYPNPVEADALQIDFQDLRAEAFVRLFDAQGRLLRIWAFDPAQQRVATLDLLGIAPGTLFLKVNEQEAIKILR